MAHLQLQQMAHLQLQQMGLVGLLLLAAQAFLLQKFAVRPRAQPEQRPQGMAPVLPAVVPASAAAAPACLHFALLWPLGLLESTTGLSTKAELAASCLSCCCQNPRLQSPSCLGPIHQGPSLHGPSHLTWQLWVAGLPGLCATALNSQEAQPLLFVTCNYMQKQAGQAPPLTRHLAAAHFPSMSTASSPRKRQSIHNLC